MILCDRRDTGTGSSENLIKISVFIYVICHIYVRVSLHLSVGGGNTDKYDIIHITVLLNSHVRAGHLFGFGRGIKC